MDCVAVWMPLRLQLNLHLLAEVAEVAEVAGCAGRGKLRLWLPRVKYHGIGNIYHCVATPPQPEQTTHNKTKALIISYEILMESQSDMQLARPESGAAAAA